jgi:hypothetical protein
MIQRAFLTRGAEPETGVLLRETFLRALAAMGNAIVVKLATASSRNLRKLASFLTRMFSRCRSYEK